MATVWLGLIDGSGDITASKIGCRYRHLRDQQFENAMPSFYEIDFKFLVWPNQYFSSIYLLDQ